MPTNIALVGIGGYGKFYLSHLLSAGPERDIQLVAGIDPYPERSSYHAVLQEAGIPVYPNLASFYEHGSADLVIISAPIQLHAPLTLLALSKGSHVLCEKPLGASMDDARQMLQAEKQSGRRVGIGYQWSFSDAVLALKRDILRGKFGKPLHFKSITLWSRARSYFQRNDWAGRIRGGDGSWILDSPVNNATAHYLHNMLFLLGSTIDSSAEPAALQAELYRANPIENYDSAALNVDLKSGEQLLFLTAHPVVGQRGPYFAYTFENAVVTFGGETLDITATFADGSVETYGSPEGSSGNKIWQMVDAVQSGGPIVCGIRTAIPQLVCALGAQEAPVHDFPRELVRIESSETDQLTWVEGLGEVFDQCYETNQMPYNSGATWAARGKMVDLSKYSDLL